MTLGPAQNLRDAIRIFNPQRPLEGEALHAYYTDRGSDARQRMHPFLDVAEGEPVSMLFTGHSGSSKSTELNKLIEELNTAYFFVKVRTGEIVPPTDLTYVDVILIAAMALFRAASDEAVIRRAPAQIVEGVWQQVEQLVDKVIFGNLPYRKPPAPSEVSLKVGIPPVVHGLTLEFEARFKNEPKTRDQIRAHMQNRLSEVIARANDLSAEIRRRYNTPVLIVVEDTDKPDLARAAELFFDHPQSLTAAASASSMKIGKLSERTTKHHALAALQLSEQLDRPGDRADALHALGDLGLREGDLKGARTSYEAALAIYRAIGDRLGEADALRALGDLGLREGDLRGARTSYEAALAIYRAIGDRLGEANALQGFGDERLQAGDFEMALSYYRQAQAIYEQITDRYSQSRNLIRMAGAHLSLEQFDDAIAKLGLAARLAGEIHDRNLCRAALDLLGRIVQSKPDLAAAAEEVRRCCTDA